MLDIQNEYIFETCYDATVICHIIVMFITVKIRIINECTSNASMVLSGLISLTKTLQCMTGLGGLVTYHITCTVQYRSC